MPSPSLPIISGRDCIRALARLATVRADKKGSHVRLVCVGRNPVTVPLHDTLDRGTLRGIIRTVDVTVEEFTRLL